MPWETQFSGFPVFKFEILKWYWGGGAYHHDTIVIVIEPFDIQTTPLLLLLLLKELMCFVAGIRILA